MPSWIIVFRADGKMPGLMGPYTPYQAQKVADRIEEKHEIIETIHHNVMKAKREIKEKLVQDYGYSVGSRRMSAPKQGSYFTQESDEDSEIRKPIPHKFIPRRRVKRHPEYQETEIDKRERLANSNIGGLR